MVSGSRAWARTDRPTGVVALHRSPELREVHRVLVERSERSSVKVYRYQASAPDRVSDRGQDRPVGTGYGGIQLFGRERQARVDEVQRRPDVMGEGIRQVGSRHTRTLAVRRAKFGR